MECHKCRITAEIEAGIWKDTPFEETACAQCQLADDSRGTMAYREADPANAAWDHSPDDETLEAAQLADGQSSAPFEHLDPGDPSVPLSVLADAMSLWMSLSLPARKVFQMRMQKLPYSAIGERLGCSRQAAEKLVAQAIAKDGRLNNLLPEKRKRAKAPLTAKRSSAIADSGKIANKRCTVSQITSFVKPCATRTA